MKLFQTIAVFEGKALFRRTGVPALLLFFFLTGLYSISHGVKVARHQLTVIDSLQTDYQNKVRELQKKLKADTSTAPGRRDYLTASNPASINFVLTANAVSMPHPFAALAIGQRDVLPFYKQIKTNKTFIEGYNAEISNPEILATGHLDLAFVLIYLLPLLIIGLCYAVRSSEKEQGTESLLLLQGISIARLVLFKLLFRFLVTGGIAFLLSALGMVYVSFYLPVQLRDVIEWYAVLSCYLFFWFTLCYAGLILLRGSAVTASCMLGAWLLFVIVLPGLLNSYLAVNHPVGLRANLASVQRELEEEIWAIPPDALLNTFYHDYPRFKKAGKEEVLATDPRRFAAYYELLEKKVSPLAERYTSRQRERIRVSRKAGYFIPPLKAQQLFNTLARSNLESFLDYQADAGRFQARWKLFFYRFVFTGSPLKEQDYWRLPVYHASRTNHRHDLSGGLFSLLAAGLFLGLTGVLIGKKQG